MQKKYHFFQYFIDRLPGESFACRRELNDTVYDFREVSGGEDPRRGFASRSICTA